MTWQYTPADIALNRAFYFRVPDLKNSTTHTIKTSNGGTKTIPTIGYDPKWHAIEFQFPPKIVSDGRKGNWVENDMVGEEQTAAFKLSGPRVITINWSYVVDSDIVNHTSWSIPRIKKQIKLIRGYFANNRQAVSDHSNLVIFVKFWAIGGPNEMSARMKSVDIKYGDTLIMPWIPHTYKPLGTPKAPLSEDNAFPLRTDISVDLRLWTTGLYEGGPAIEDAIADQNKLLAMTEEWY